MIKEKQAESSSKPASITSISFVLKSTPDWSTPSKSIKIPALITWTLTKTFTMINSKKQCPSTNKKNSNNKSLTTKTKPCMLWESRNNVRQCLTALTYRRHNSPNTGKGTSIMMNKKHSKSRNMLRKTTMEDRLSTKPMISIFKENSSQPKWPTSYCRHSSSTRITWNTFSRKRKTRRTKLSKNWSTTNGCRSEKRLSRRKMTKWCSGKIWCSKSRKKKNAVRESPSSSTRT